MFRTVHMRRSIQILLALALLGLWSGPASAFFENTTVNPSARGMGGAGVAVIDPAFSPMVNPAQLGRTVRGAGAVSYVRPFGYDFSDFVYAGAALPVNEQYGHFGVAVSHFGVSHQDTDLLSETRVTLAHGLTLFSDMHSTIDFGYALNMYHVDLGQTVSDEDPGSAAAAGVDLGLLVTLRKRTHLAFQVYNLNNADIGEENEELGRRLVAGIAYEPYDGVVTTFEFDNELGERLQYHGGVGFRVVEGFQLRAGISTNPSKLTGGFGYTLDRLAFDYGFSTGGGTLDNTHQFGLKFAWGGEAQ
jgi:hypothetical protein